MQVVWQESNSGAASLKCKMCELSVLVLKNFPILCLECAAGLELLQVWPGQRCLGPLSFHLNRAKKGRAAKGEAEALESKFCPNLSLSAATSRRFSNAEGRKSCLRGISGNTELALCCALTPEHFWHFQSAFQGNSTHFYHPITKGLT